MNPGRPQLYARLPLPRDTRMRQLFELVDASGRTLVDIATEAGVSLDAIYHWRLEKRRPSFASYEAVLNSLGYETAVIRRD